jgi:pimeloyl-ACP methyl ester carboxylesterase
MSVAKTAAVAVTSNHAPPANLKDLAAKADQPMLLIAAPNSGHGEQLNRGYHAAAGANSTLWEIPESGHIAGIEARPAAYERRVVGFFSRTLRP